jgi:hypothetical protein
MLDISRPYGTFDMQGLLFFYQYKVPLGTEYW